MQSQIERRLNINLTAIDVMNVADIMRHDKEAKTQADAIRQALKYYQDYLQKKAIADGTFFTEKPLPDNILEPALKEARTIL